MLLDLCPEGSSQGELDMGDEEEPQRDRGRLMSAMDVLNGRFGRGTVQTASSGAPDRIKEWGQKQERRTPQYTTCLADIPLARA